MLVTTSDYLLGMFVTTFDFLLGICLTTSDFLLGICLTISEFLLGMCRTTSDYLLLTVVGAYYNGPNSNVNLYVVQGDFPIKYGSKTL